MFGVAKFQIFLGIPDIPCFFFFFFFFFFWGGGGVDAGYKPTYLEKK